MAHPHVERTIEAKREAAIGLVELHRGHADIHHDAVDALDALCCANLGQIGEAVLDQCQPAARLIDQIEPGRDRGPVAVDADHPCAGEIENGPAIAAGPEGGVEIDAAVAGLEHLDGFAAQHGNMTRGLRIHAQAPEQVPKLSGLSNRYWTRTGPLRLKCLRFAGLFRSKSPRSNEHVAARWPIPRVPNRKP